MNSRDQWWKGLIAFVFNFALVAQIVFIICCLIGFALAVWLEQIHGIGVMDFLGVLWALYVLSSFRRR